jgi:hypothetical protein
LMDKAGAGCAGSAEAGVKEQTGGLRLSPESLSLREDFEYPVKGGIRTGALADQGEEKAA